MFIKIKKPNKFKKLMTEIEVHFKRQNDQYKFDKTGLNNQLNQIKMNTDYLRKTIDSQQRTIESLTSVLQGKYDKGMFIFTEEGSYMPTVIKDGQVLTNGRISSVDVNWDYNRGPCITIERG